MVFAKRFVMRFFSCLPSSAILMFHHVGVEPERQISSCNISIDYFIYVADLIEGFSAPIEDAIKKNNRIAVSFDDGYEEVYSVCYPLLKERRIPFTVFIVEDFIGKAGYLSEKQLLELCEDDLVSIGSHGKTHRILTSLDEAGCKKEILSSKENIGRRLNKPISLFAYSHGQRNNKYSSFLHEYTYGFSANSLVLNCFTRRDKFYLPRLNMTDELFNTNLSLIARIIKKGRK